MLQKLGAALSILSATTILLTVLSLPWMLGGVIPLARLVLLVGAIIAAVLSMLANLLQRKRPHALPAVLIPVVGLALLGTFQLRPAQESPAMRMNHAVAEPILPSTVSNFTHTLIPPDTRSTVATLLALALLSCVAFDQIRTPRTLVVASILIFANGLGIAAVGMTHMLQAQQFSLNALWSLGDTKELTTVFSTFVNPNNAAGWLCLCAAVSAGWITWHLQPRSTSPSLRRGRLRISFFGRIWQRAVEFLADLTAWQIVTLTGAALLAAGVAATQSRGGMMALATGILLTAFCRSKIQTWPIVLALLFAFGLTTFGVLHWLELDVGVISELETLKDLEQAAGKRPEHWIDSLAAVQDFPLTGTGLGSYRFATPSYARHHSGVWFRNADNHYVDMAIEGGIIGLLLFIMIGIIGLATGFAAWQQSKTKTTARHSASRPLSRRALAGLGTAVILATLTQAVAAFLDYGVGLPAASALLVLIISAVSGFLIEGSVAAKLKESGALRFGWVGLPVQLILVVLAASQFQDQLAATRIDEPVVDGYQMLNSPVQISRLGRIGELKATLKERLVMRNDDVEGLRMMTLLADAEFRLAILRMGLGATLEDNPEFSRLWDYYSIQVLVSQLAQTERQQPLTGKQLRQQMLQVLRKTQLPEFFESLQQLYPTMPRLAEGRADIAVLLKDDELFENQVRIARFADPSNGGTLFKLGSLGLRCGRPDLTKTVWQQCLTLSSLHRPFILMEAREEWTAVEALELFGPRDYVECVEAAETCPDVDLKYELRKRAEELWTTIDLPVDAQSALVRVEQLRTTGREEQAVEWLQETLKEHPEDVPLRRHFAQILEKQLHFIDARREWERILYLASDDKEAQKAITRIRTMKSPEDSVPVKND